MTHDERFFGIKPTAAERWDQRMRDSALRELERDAAIERRRVVRRIVLAERHAAFWSRFHAVVAFIRRRPWPRYGIRCKS